MEDSVGIFFLSVFLLFLRKELVVLSDFILRFVSAFFILCMTMIVYVFVFLCLYMCVISNDSTSKTHVIFVKREVKSHLPTMKILTYAPS